MFNVVSDISFWFAVGLYDVDAGDSQLHGGCGGFGLLCFWCGEGDEHDGDDVVHGGMEIRTLTLSVGAFLEHKPIVNWPLLGCRFNRHQLIGVDHRLDTILCNRSVKSIASD